MRDFIANSIAVFSTTFELRGADLPFHSGEKKILAKFLRKKTLKKVILL
jgi:hypothetical protein